MFTIREGVFETNSSSTHSIALNPKSYSKYEAKFHDVNSENKIQVRLGRYGWGYEVLYSSDEKLSYIMTMLVLNLIDFVSPPSIISENLSVFSVPFSPGFIPLSAISGELRSIVVLNTW